MTTIEEPFREGSAPFQRELRFRRRDGEHAAPFPRILEGGGEAVGEYLAAANALATRGDTLRRLLSESGGAIQFKGTPLRTAEDFSAFLHVLAQGSGWTAHVDKGLMVVRRPYAANVATANEGPSDQEIGSHNEYGLSAHYPSYIAFFCLSEPEVGGATPIASSFELRERLEEEVPTYMEAIEREGLSFAIHHPREIIAGHLQGNGVFSANAFGPPDGNVTGTSEVEKRAIVERNVEALAREDGWAPGLPQEEPVWRRRGYSALWQDDGSLLVKQRVPGVRMHPAFGVPTYFNNVHNRLHYADMYKREVAAGKATLLQLPPEIVGESGERALQSDWVEAVRRVTGEAQVDVTWRVGDVLLLDNLAVQHGRRPWRGDRRLLASLWD